MAIFGPKPWVIPFGKKSIFGLFGFFSFQNRVTDIFLAYSLKKSRKMAIFGQNHGLTPLQKCRLFYFLNFLFLQPRKAFFLFYNMVKDLLLAFITLQNKKLENLPFLDQNHWLTPWGKRQFLDFLNFLFLQPRRAFFVFRIS